jgi:hypothetical protein
LHVERYPTWWGEAWKCVTPIGDMLPGNVGAGTEVLVGGFLPYTITLELEATHIERPHLIAVTSRCVWKAPHLAAARV